MNLKEEMECIWVYYPIAFPNHRAGWLLKKDFRVVTSAISYYSVDNLKNLVLFKGRRAFYNRRKRHALHSR